MGYIFLMLSLAAGTIKGFCGKQTSRYVNEYRDAMLANFVRMILCSIIGLIVVIFSNDIHLLAFNRTEMLIAFLSGAANSAFVVLWLMAVKKDAYMMLDVFCMIGILIPIIGSAALFGESIETKHVLGVAILIVAVCIMCSYNNSIKSRLTISNVIILIMCGISNGLSDFSQKLFMKMSDGVAVAVFNFYTYAISSLVLLVCWLISVGVSKTRDCISLKPILRYIVIMSICLLACSYFKTLAAGMIPSAQLYPAAQGGALIISSIMSIVLFKEKPNAKLIIGISMSFVALMVINIL